jgi:polysaccharide export outer membrane protein
MLPGMVIGTARRKRTSNPCCAWSILRIGAAILLLLIGMRDQAGAADAPAATAPMPGAPPASTAAPAPSAAPAQPAAPQPAAPQSSAPQPQHSYRLFPGDLVHIEVFDHPELTTLIRIAPNGVFTFPLIGTVHALGRNAEELGLELQRRLEDGYLVHAPVVATVNEFGPRKAFVMGAVAHQEAVTLSPYVDTTALQAIDQLGGFLDDADRKNALVIRDDPEHPGAKITLPLPSGDTGSALAHDVILESGDIIMVPHLDRVYVIGRVHTVGAMHLLGQEQLTVSKAVSLAGGFDLYAKKSKVQLIRGGRTIATVDVEGILDGQVHGQDPVLLPGDTVFVPEGSF